MGYDRDERLYYLLDDNRLYRRTDPPIPPAPAAKPKANSKRGRALARAAKRRKLAQEEEEEDEDMQQTGGNVEDSEDPSRGYKWECVAITLADFQAFIDKLKKSRDEDERNLRDYLVDEVMPVIEHEEEEQQKKIQRREKELVTLQKLATAKRSSRIAGKQERERQEMLAAEEEMRREREKVEARKAEEMKAKAEKDRSYRLMTREQRLKDREDRRRQHEEQIAAMNEQAKKLETGEGRLSERQLKAEMEKHKKDLESLKEEDQWIFDCSVCGIHGENVVGVLLICNSGTITDGLQDDGSHSVACEKCNVWQHSKCLGIAQAEAEKDDFHFICADCQRRIEDAKKPKLPPLKFRLPASMSPSSAAGQDAIANGEKSGRTQVPGQESPVKKAKRPPVSPGRPVHPGIPQAANATARMQQAINGGAPLPSHGIYPSPSYGPNGSVAQNQNQPPYNPQFRQLPPNGHFQNPNAVPQNRHLIPTNESLRFSQHQPPAPAATSFNSQRPSSSYSAQGTYPSPIQNRPSMSPTQGNRDVGPLAGFPPSATPNGTGPDTPFNRTQTFNHLPSSPYPMNNHSPSVSFSSTVPTNTQNSFTHHTPPPPPHHSMNINHHYSPTVPLSGLSPTKHSPTRTPSFTSSTPVGNTAIVPPVQKLHPSPKLMGRSSPDAPVPTPVKSMTPEQEDRRRRELEAAARMRGQGQGRLDFGTVPAFQGSPLGDGKR